MLAFKLGSPPPPPPPLPSLTQAKKRGRFRVFAGNFKTGAGTAGSDDGFPPFLPKEVEKIKDPFARSLAQRIERLPVKVCIPFFPRSVCFARLTSTFYAFCVSALFYFF